MGIEGHQASYSCFISKIVEGMAKSSYFMRKSARAGPFGYNVGPISPPTKPEAKNIEKIASKSSPDTNFERHAGREHGF